MITIIIKSFLVVHDLVRILNTEQDVKRTTNF